MSLYYYVRYMWVTAKPSFHCVTLSPSYNEIATTAPLLLATFLLVRNPEARSKNTACKNYHFKYVHHLAYQLRHHVRG
jgi:hypothetical protein